MSQLPAEYFLTPVGRGLREHERTREGFAPGGWWLCDRCRYRAPTMVCAVMSTSGYCAGCREPASLEFIARRHMDDPHLEDARWWIVIGTKPGSEPLAMIVQGADEKEARGQARRAGLYGGEVQALGPYSADAIAETTPRYRKLDERDIRFITSGT